MINTVKDKNKIVFLLGSEFINDKNSEKTDYRFKTVISIVAI